MRERSVPQPGRSEILIEIAAEMAPLLCAGLIGWRSYRMAGEGRAIGLYGFGADAREFLAIAPQAGIKMQVTCYPLSEANAALDDLRAGRFEGAAVLIP